jgi:primosomal protein N' (replication factor Y)
VPSFAVDDGFAYAVPDDVSGVEVGTMVRVPLGGRRVKGYVTSVRTATPDRPLRSILARSGEVPVFSRGLLETARWVSTHYVAPLSVVLARTAPPNLPRMVADPVFEAPATSSTKLAAWSGIQISVGRTRPRYVVSGQPPVQLITPAISPVVAANQNVLVCAPTVEEAAATASGLGEVFGDRVMLATSPSSPADRTNAWSLAAGDAGVVIVGTREIAFWGAESVGLAVIIEEGRRAYKAKQTPTYHVRDVLRRRSAVERFGFLLVGAVPTTDVIAAGVELSRGNGRVWPLVEVADRAQDSSGSGLIMERTRIAIGAALRADGSVFVLVPRRGYAGAFRCVRCRELRRCTNCGARLEQSGTCQRCGTEHGACVSCGGTRFEPLGAGIGRVVDDLRRSFGESVGEVGSAANVRVGTERDLVDLEPVDLAVAIDADGMMLAPHYRAAEDALRILVRLTLATTPGRGRKALIQTAIPSHPVITALRSGRPFPFLDDELGDRAASGFPPVGALLAIETDAPLEVAEPALQAAGQGVTVLGPAAWAGGNRWLLQGDDLSEVRIRLRSVVQTLRDGGSRVRVDADPVDL